MDTLWNKLMKGLQESALAAADKAGDLTRVARARLDIAAVKNQLHHTQAELGARVHELLTANADPARDDQVQSLSQQLTALSAELTAGEKAYDALQSELQTRADIDDESEDL